MLKVPAKTFQKTLAKALKGAGNNKNNVITSLIEIKTVGNKIAISTTDGNNYMVAYMPNESTTEPFKATLTIDTFSKLVGRIETGYIELDFDDKDNLVVTADTGKYVLELPLDEDGKNIAFPPVDTEKTGDYHKWSIKDIELLIRSCSGALLPENRRSEFESLCSYCFNGGSVLSCNSTVASKLNSNLLDGVLVEPRLINLIQSVANDDIDVYVTVNDNGITVIKVYTNDVVIYNTNWNTVETYPQSNIMEFFNGNKNKYVVVDRFVLISSLERVSLFVSAYDNSLVHVKYDNGKFIISDKENHAVETVRATDVFGDIAPIEFDISYTDFKSGLASFIPNTVDVTMSDALVGLHSSNLSVVISHT